MSKTKDNKLPPIHPGEILREDYIRPLGLTARGLAMALHVPATRISEIVHERRAVTADTAIRLGRYFKTSARFWLTLQISYDLEVIDGQKRNQIEGEVRISSEATT